MDKKNYFWNFNFFPNEIIETEEQEFIILVFIHTLINEKYDLNDLKEEETLDLIEAPIRRLKKYLSENIYISNQIEKLTTKINEYNMNTNDEEKINFDYSLTNYKNLCLYIKKKIKKDKEDFFIYVLEFCFVVAFQSILKLEKEYTINLFLFDNFNKIKKPNLFKTLEKNGVPIELIKDEKLKKYFQDSPDNIIFDEKKLIYKIDNKDQVVPAKYNEFYQNKIKERNINQYLLQPDIEFLQYLESNPDDKLYLKGIIPIMYIGQYIKFVKLYYIQKNEDLSKADLKDLKDYVDRTLKMTYLYPKSAYIELFITIFLVYKIVNSPYINLQRNLYNLDFNQAYINYINSSIISTAIKFDNRIHTVTFTQNKIGETGMYEAGISFSFNKKISVIDFSQMNITTTHLHFLLKGFCTDSVENIVELNLSNNTYFSNTIETGTLLAKIIRKFPNLNSLNLNKCKLQSSIKPILIELNRLFSTGKYELKTLLISMNEMNISSLFCLGDLVKNSNCKIEVLSCGYSNYHNKGGEYFLKSICQNEYIQELYLYQAQLEDSDYPILEYTIRNSKLNIFSLYKNNIKNFETILKLFSLTSIIRIGPFQKLEYNQNQLYSLDLSDNPINPISILNYDLAILTNICKKTGLSMFDLAHIIHGNTNDTKLVKDTNNQNNSSGINNDMSLSTIDASNEPVQNIDGQPVRIIDIENSNLKNISSNENEEDLLLSYIYKVQDHFKMIY